MNDLHSYVHSLPVFYEHKNIKRFWPGNISLSVKLMHTENEVIIKNFQKYSVNICVFFFEGFLLCIDWIETVDLMIVMGFLFICKKDMI